MPNVPVASVGSGTRPPLRAELRGAIVLATTVTAVAAVGLLVFVAGLGLIQADSLRLSILLLGALATLAAALAYKLRRGVVAPLESLAQAAEAVTAGKIVGFPSSGPVEFGIIAQALQSLSEGVLRERSQRMRLERFATAGRLSAGIVHELGNPLGSIVASVELLRARVGDAPDALALLEKVDRELARTDRIARGLLDLARPRTPASLKSDFNQAVRGAVRVLSDQRALRHHTVALELDAGNPLIFGHAHDIEQIFINLLLNAVDATPAGGTIAVHSHRFPRAALQEGVVRRAGDAPLTIRPRHDTPRVTAWLESVRPPAEVVNVIVVDSGSGVPPADTERIFEPFFTSKSRGLGTGLGLAVVASLVDAMNGTIWVERSREGGAAFHMLFPVAVGSGVAAVTNRSDQPATA